MREIKFRAWDSFNKHMDTVFNIVSHGEWNIFMLSDFLDRWAGKEYILMQYTGLKDKNGKEIYEGDIVWRNNPHIIRFGESDMCENIGFYLKEIGNHEIHTLFAYTTPFKIIGNIYENPELLER